MRNGGRRSIARRSPALLAVLGVVVSTLTVGAGERVPATAAVSTTRFAPLDIPLRVLDTRQDDSPVGRLAAGGALSIDPVPAAVAASAGVQEADVVAVVLNVTLDRTGGWGFATVYPTGEAPPGASSINTDTPGQTIANTVTSRRGDGGMVTIHSSVATDVIVDVQGVYVGATESSAGRFVGLPGARALDTRPTTEQAAGTTRRIDAAPAGIPANASAAVLNVAAVDPLAGGFLTVWDGADSPPHASNVNYAAGSNIANQAITALDAGTISVYTSATSHILVDVVGYITGPGDALTTTGLFVPLSPSRAFDSRTAVAPTFGAQVDGTVSFGVLGRAGLPASGVAAIDTNTTVTDTSGSGFATVWGDGGRPAASSLNSIGVGRTIANHVITDVTDLGCVNLYQSAAAGAIVDVTGYFVGPVDPQPSPLDLCDGTLSPPAAAPPSAPSTGAHSFLFTASPPPPPPGYGRWNPCSGSIEYAINPLRATQREIDELTFALREVERATGFDFVPFEPDPTTSEGLDDRRPPPGADFLIGFSDPAATSVLGGGVLGVGGGFWSPASGRIGLGYTILDVPQLTDPHSLRTALLHELGHAMGLGHVGDPVQVMFPSLSSSSPTMYASGDLEGLWRLGTAQDCFPARPGGDDGPTVRVESELRLAPGGA